MHSNALLVLLSLCLTCEALKWTVQNAENATCLILQVDEITANLNVVNAITGEVMPLQVSINTTDIATGHCGNVNDTLEVSFFPDRNASEIVEEKPWRLRIQFKKEQLPSEYSLMFVYYLADYVIDVPRSDYFNTTAQNFTSTSSRNFDIGSVPLGLGYKCSTCTLLLSSNSTIYIKNVEFIAHALLDTPDLSKVQMKECSRDFRFSDHLAKIFFAGLIALFAISFCVHYVCFEKSDDHLPIPQDVDGEVNEGAEVD